MASAAEYKRISHEDDRAEEFDIDEDDPVQLSYVEQPGHAATGNADNLQRKLDNRHIQLIAIGGSIGTALFVSIGDALHKGGPASLVLAFIVQSLIVACVNNCMAEMAVMHPVSGGFVRMAGKWVDDALGFMAGYNFFLYQALLVPFEITALNMVLKFWGDDVPVAAVCALTIVCYAALNVFAVSAYGEAEFWLSGGKVVLIWILFLFTLLTSLGINPKGDAYGFRYWYDPGAFAEYLSTGTMGRFEGFLACLWAAAFTVVGPEYIAMVAAEARRPRVYIKAAFETVYLRFGLFFIGGALCTGLVIPYNDAQLVKILTKSDTENAAASPYVIAMTNLGITALPSVVNALLVTSIFSAGSTCTYCATRSLYSLAIEGRAPRVLQKVTKNGVPIACFGVVICFPFLSFLAVSRSSAQVLTWLVSLTTAAGLIDYIVICITYLRFYYACQVQGVDRSRFPYKGRMQPFCAWVGLVCMSVVCLCYGYTAFRSLSGITSFFFHYTMVIVDPMLFLFWKLYKRTELLRLRDVDLVWEKPIIDAYELSLTDPPVSFWGELIQLFRRSKKPAAVPQIPTDETSIPMLAMKGDKQDEVQAEEEHLGTPRDRRSVEPESM